MTIDALERPASNGGLHALSTVFDAPFDRYDADPSPQTIATLAVIHQEHFSGDYTSFETSLGKLSHAGLRGLLAFTLYLPETAIADVLVRPAVIYGLWRYLRLMRDLRGFLITPTTVAEWQSLVSWNIELHRILATSDDPVALLDHACRMRWAIRDTATEAV